MSVKEIKEAIEQKKILFGIRQALKEKKIKKIFVAKDAREETTNKLEKSKLKFDFLKSKKELAKELNLDFESEVFSIKQ